MVARSARRRSDSAAETRRLIVETARELFGREGYAASTLDSIAAAAGVAVATVYASVGPKPVLLAEIIVSDSADPVLAEEMQVVLAQEDGAEIVSRTVAASRAANERHRAIIELMLTLSPRDDVLPPAVKQATANYRENVDRICRRLADIGALRPELDAGRASDILWFLLGLGSWQRFIIDSGWSWDDAEAWLAQAVASSLLASAT